jgi:hypothetical protein
MNFVCMDICSNRSGESWKECLWLVGVHCKVVAVRGARDVREAEAHEGRAWIGHKGSRGGWI